MPRKLTFFLYVCLAACLIAGGCGQPASAGPKTPEDVAKFQGDPKSPDLQNALKAGFGAAPKPGAPPAQTSVPNGG